MHSRNSDSQIEHLKRPLLTSCHDMINERIATIEEAMKTAAAAANEESKSSAGDKYETTRAMMHLEIEKNQQQMAEALKLRRVIEEVNPGTVLSTAELGACVFTEQGNYFLCISAGKIKVDQREFFVVSPASPIGQAMLGLKQGDTFHFRGKAHEITEVK